MRKFFVLFFLLFVFLFSFCVSGSLTVSPLDVSVVMDDVFVSGNTSKGISVRNNGDELVNVSWYVEDPEPISLISPNRSCVPDLSWVGVEPGWCLVEPGGVAVFFVYLDVPERDDLRGMSWEFWVTFRVLSRGSISVENAVRVYVDTPPVLVGGGFGLFLFFVGVVLLVVFVVFLFFRMK